MAGADLQLKRGVEYEGVVGRRYNAELHQYRVGNNEPFVGGVRAGGVKFRAVKMLLVKGRR